MNRTHNIEFYESSFSFNAKVEQKSEAVLEPSQLAFKKFIVDKTPARRKENGNYFPCISIPPLLLLLSIPKTCGKVYLWRDKTWNSQKFLIFLWNIRR